jgi:hypothetical protein
MHLCFQTTVHRLTVQYWWTIVSFVKTTTFMREQEGCRNDVSRHLKSSKFDGLLFGILQIHEIWTQCRRWCLICVIMHNMILEDECEGANQLQRWDFQRPLITSEHVPQEFKAYLQMHCNIRHRATYDQLQVDLVEHLCGTIEKIKTYVSIF